MAKKINTEEKTRTDAYETIPAEAASPAKPIHAETGQPEASLPIQSQKPAERNHPGAQATDARTLDLLKKFPTYASLYIDAHGGTFAPDTPAVIRGEAVLYKNPYYDELKTQV